MRSSSTVCLFAIVLATSLCADVRGDVIVTADPVTFSGGLYHYDYTVTNTGPDDLAVLDFLVPAKADAIASFSEPGGLAAFQTQFDSGLGLASFLENGSNFGPSPISGFSFDSPYGPGPTQFQANLFNLDTGDPDTTLGPIIGPVLASVPEPSSFILGGLGALGLFVAARRRRKA